MAGKTGPSGYDTSKGTIRFAPPNPLPDVDRELVQARITENAIR